MSFEISQRFYFESAHTLDRNFERLESGRIHGHTYEATVFVIGALDSATGMVMDLEILRREIQSVRQMLDHKLLNQVDGLGPPTMENLARYVHEKISQRLAGVSKVVIERPSSGDSCIFLP